MWLLAPMLLPQQTMQIGWLKRCLDQKIRSDHFQITVWTACLKDLMCETNLIFLQSEQNLYGFNLVSCHGNILLMRNTNK